MKVVVTGGSGFIGTNLVSHHLQQNWEVVNYDIAEPRNRSHMQYWRKVDILNRDRLISETRSFNPHVFLHFAARTDLAERENLGGYSANIEGVCNVIDAIRCTPSIQRVIFASSQLVCRLGYSPKHDLDFQPSTLYGKSKVLTERIIRTADEIGAIWTIVRPTSLWGPWFDIPYKNFFTTISKNLYVHPGGVKTLKQWGFSGNTMFQIQKLLEAPDELVHKKTFYLADYEPITLRDFANKVQEALRAKPIKTVPLWLLKTVASIGDIAQKLGWKNPPLTSFRLYNIMTSEVQNVEPLRAVVGPLPYSIDAGIEKTVNWLRHH